MGAPAAERPTTGRPEPSGQDRLGTALAIGAAFSFGCTIALNRSVAKSGVNVGTALGVRFSVAALVLVALLVVRRMPLVPVRGERVAALLLGAVGYLFEASLFYLALGRGTAAAVSLLFYAYPALVAALELALGWQRHHSRVLWALGLSAGGTVLVVASGSRVSISTAGIVLALGSAASFAVYLLVSSRLVRRTHPLVVSAWVAGGAGVAFLLGTGALGVLDDPGRHWSALVGNGAATASAFALMFAALGHLGPTRASVVMTLEAFFAIALAAVFLGEGLRPLQAVGGAAVLGAAVLAGLRRTQRPPIP